MGGFKEFWRHLETGEIYVIESTAFGRVIGAAGPLDPNDLVDADDYECTPKINIWINRAIDENKLRRITVKATHSAKV